MVNVDDRFRAIVDPAWDSRFTSCCSRSRWCAGVASYWMDRGCPRCFARRKAVSWPNDVDSLGLRRFLGHGGRALSVVVRTFAKLQSCTTWSREEEKNQLVGARANCLLLITGLSSSAHLLENHLKYISRYIQRYEFCKHCTGCFVWKIISEAYIHCLLWYNDDYYTDTDPQLQQQASVFLLLAILCRDANLDVLINIMEFQVGLP